LETAEGDHTLRGQRTPGDLVDREAAFACELSGEVTLAHVDIVEPCAKLDGLWKRGIAAILSFVARLSATRV